MVKYTVVVVQNGEEFKVECESYDEAKAVNNALWHYGAWQKLTMDILLESEKSQ